MSASRSTLAGFWLLMAAGAGWPPAWVAPAEPFHIADGIYYVGSQVLGAYLFTTDAGLVLLDGGLPEMAAQIEANLHTLGFELSDVKILLNSHAHFDHSGALAELKRKSGAILLARAIPPAVGAIPPAVGAIPPAVGAIPPAVGAISRSRTHSSTPTPSPA